MADNDHHKPLYQALFNAQKDISSIGKDSSGNLGRYTKAEDMLVACRELLHRHGLLCMRTAWNTEPVPGSTEYIVKMQFNVIHVESGAGILLNCSMPAVPRKGSPADKATASTLTYAWTYWLRDLLLLPRVSDQDKRDVDQQDDSSYTPAANDAKVKELL